MNKSNTNNNKSLTKPQVGRVKRNKNPSNPNKMKSSVNVSAPVSQARISISKPAQFKASKNGDVRVIHREYCQDLPGSVGFNEDSFFINPGRSTLFPWLSSLANNFESYIFNRLRFCYETESSTASTGTVILAVDYDASDPVPSSKAQVMAYQGAVRSPAWAPCCFEASKESLSKRKSYFVRLGAVPSGSDIHLYDVGVFYACTQGMASTAAVGELYVEYDVTLMTPQLNDIGIGQSLWAHYSGTTNAAPFVTALGTLALLPSSTGTTASTTTFTFNSSWEGIASVVLTGTGIGTDGSAGTATVSSIGEVTNAGGTEIVSVTAIKATPGQTFVLGIANTTITQCDIFFGQGGF